MYHAPVRQAAANPFRLSLLHLLLWTAATAVAVTLMHPPGAAEVQPRVALVNAAFAPVYGLRC